MSDTEYQPKVGDRVNLWVTQWDDPWPLTVHRITKSGKVMFWKYGPTGNRAEGITLELGKWHRLEMNSEP